MMPANLSWSTLQCGGTRSQCHDSAVGGLLRAGVPPRMTLKLSCVNNAAKRVLAELVEGLDIGDSKKFDRGIGYMPVHVECLQKSGLGLHFSIAHYYEQNGDLVPDPDVVVIRRADGSWAPISFQNSISYRNAVTFHEDGTIEVDEREQKELSRFVNHWMKNVSDQQAIPTRRGR